MLSDHGRRDWQAFSEASRHAGAGSEELNRFLIGLYRRGEAVDRQDLQALLEATSLPAGAQERILSFIPPALHLLATYDQVVRHEEEWFDEEEMAGPGYLVI